MHVLYGLFESQIMTAVEIDLHPSFCVINVNRNLIDLSKERGLRLTGADTGCQQLYCVVCVVTGSRAAV